jgi:HAD superfamily hydrolase (TIGR01484 family)
MYKHYFFDLDNTLTRSRTLASEDMQKQLDRLSKFSDVVIVSGAQLSQVIKQVPLDSISAILSQNGNVAIKNLLNNCSVVWEHRLSDEELREIFEHIEDVLITYQPLLERSGYNPQDTVENRGCQVAFSLLGHNADKYLKEQFDKGGSLRTKILKAVPFHSKTVEVRIGGTTCLDYFKKGYNKGFNVEQFIQYNGWNKEDCLYFGDALFSGGNDETVVGVIDCQEVKDEIETLELIKQICEA